MAIIINELSLDGQYADKNDFYIDLKKIILIITSFNQFKLNILKCYSFYNCKVTSTNILHDFLKTNDDDIMGFKNILVQFINKPFWEDLQRHNCNDTYECEFTTSKCSYGLAEAVENFKTVMSFNHNSFNTNPIEINKNTQPNSLFNIYNVDSLIHFLNINIDNQIIPYELNSKEYLPNKILTDGLLNIENVEASWLGIGHEEQIASYKKWGNIVAKFNFWRLNTVITNLNDRDVFSKQVNYKTHYLSIDTENGTFELFNHNGIHLGEFNFRFKRTQDAGSHTINLN